MLAISIITNVTGIGSLFLSGGANYFGLFFMCLVWGMLGSFISLSMSKWMAKTFMGVQLITLDGPHRNLVETVHRLSRRAGLTEMPEVGIYQGEELNAFATGPSRNNSLVAVSTGLLRNMNDDEVEGVLAHEVAHIANGDMVTLALIQGVLNAFVMFFARIVTMIIDQQMRDNDKNGEGLGFLAYHLVYMLLQAVFGIFASMVVAWFSRYREFRADYGGADLAGKNKMIAALSALERFYPQLENAEVDDKKQNFQAMQISSKNRFLQLLSSHPPLKDRIQSLKESQLR
jgi:heat shock protein HtpX